MKTYLPLFALLAISFDGTAIRQFRDEEIADAMEIKIGISIASARLKTACLKAGGVEPCLRTLNPARVHIAFAFKQ
jgi:hypothetical protein